MSHTGPREGRFGPGDVAPAGAAIILPVIEERPKKIGPNAQESVPMTEIGDGCTFRAQRQLSRVFCAACGTPAQGGCR